MSTALQSLQEEMKAELDTLKETVSKPSGFSISTRNKMFTTPDGESSPGPLECIILDWRNANLYYPKVYNANAPESPDCFAIGKMIKEMVPSSNCEEPQSSSCENCTLNEFGSGANGRGKACKNTVRLAVVPANATPDTQPWVLKLSPTSLTEWSNYTLKLQNKYGLLPIQVVTEVSFDPNETFPKLKFGNEKPHDVLENVAPLRVIAAALLEQEPK